MPYLEPDDPIEVTCTECGEEENLTHVSDAIWICNVCEDTFSDGSDNTYEDDYQIN